jgi:hypothetical protein
VADPCGADQDRGCGGVGARVAVAGVCARPVQKGEEREWKGWHAFRRGLATNLYELGVAPKVIQGILRHSDIGTTLQFYTQVPESATKDALNQLDQFFSDFIGDNIEESDESVTKTERTGA